MFLVVGYQNSFQRERVAGDHRVQNANRRPVSIQLSAYLGELIGRRRIPGLDGRAN